MQLLWRLALVKKLSPLSFILIFAIAAIVALPSFTLPHSFGVTPAKIQSGDVIHCSTSATLTLANDTVAGHVLIVGVDYGSAEAGPSYTVDLSDTQGNSFTDQVSYEQNSALSPPDGGGEYFSGIYTATIKDNASDAITLTAKDGASSTDTCYSIQAIEVVGILSTAINTAYSSGTGNCCQLNSSLTLNAIDFGTALTNDNGEGTWRCTSEFSCLSASPTAFFGGNGVGEYQVITGNGTSNDFSMSYTEAKDLFVETGAVFAAPIPPVIVYDTGSSNGGCNVSTVENNITTSSNDEVIIGLVSWSNTSAFTITSGWNFRYSDYIAPGGSGNNQYGENLTEYWEDAPTAGLYSLNVFDSPTNPEACIGVLEFAVIGVNTTAPFDPSFTLPSLTTDSTGTPSGSVTATTNPNDMILGLEGDQESSNQVAGSGFTLSQTNSAGEDVSSEYDIVTTTQSSLTVPFGTALTYPWIQFTDALTNGDGTGKVTSMTTQTNYNVCCVNTQYASTSNFLSTVTSTSLTTTSKTTTSKTTTSFTRQYPFIDDVAINIPANKNFDGGYYFLVDNSGSGGQAELTQISLTYPNSRTQITYNEQFLPITVSAASKAELAFNLAIATPGLAANSYTIQGEATFLKFNGPTFAYVTSPFSVTVNAGNIWTSVFPWLILILIIVVIATIPGLILHHQHGRRKHRY